MKRIFIIIIGLIVTLSLIFTKPVQAQITDQVQTIDNLITIADYTRAYYLLCYAQETVPDFCNEEAAKQVEQNLKLIIQLYLFGSFSQIHSRCPDERTDAIDYDLPGANKLCFKFSNATREGETVKVSSLPSWFSNDIVRIGKASGSKLWKSKTNSSEEVPQLSLDASTTTKLLQELPLYTSTVVNSCLQFKKSDKQAQLCSDVMNIDSPNAQYISMFSPVKLTPTYLRQMVWNAIDNGGLSEANLTNYLGSFTNEDYTRMEEIIAKARNGSFLLLGYTGDSNQAPERAASPLGPLGWLLVIVGDFLSKASDGIFEFINKSFLPISLSSTTDEMVRSTWQQFRNLANIGLVIALLVIIFSQVTNFGLSNYGVKKALPKLILATLIVNLSFFMTQFLVDVSNIISQGIYSIFNGDSLITSASFAEKANSQTGAFLSQLIALVMLILAMVLTILAGLLNMLLLVIRNALVSILVITAPIAFVALIFPRTARVSQIWWRALFSALTIFPIIAIMVGGGKLAHDVLIGSGDSMQFLLAKLAFTGPLIAAPFVSVKALKSITLLASLPVFSRLSQLTADNIIQGLRNRIQNRPGYKLRQEAKLNRSLARQASSTSRFGARAALQAKKKLDQKLEAQVKTFTTQDASRIIASLAHNVEPANLSASGQSHYNLLRRQFSAQQIAQVMARVQMQSVAAPSTNYLYQETLPEQVIQGLNASAGASKLPFISPIGQLRRIGQDLTENLPEDSTDAKSRFETTVSELRKAGDFRTAGILTAFQQTTGQYAGFDLDALRNADTGKDLGPNNPHAGLQAAIEQATRQELRTIFKPGSTNSGNFIASLRATHIEAGSLANKVLIQEMYQNTDLRDAIIDNYDHLDTQTKEILGIDQTSLQNLRNLENSTTNAIDYANPVERDALTKLAQRIGFTRSQRDQEYQKNYNQALAQMPNDPAAADRYALFKVKHFDDLIKTQTDSLNRQITSKNPTNKSQLLDLADPTRLDQSILNSISTNQQNRQAIVKAIARRNNVRL